MSSIAYALPPPQWRYQSSQPLLRLVLLIAVVLHALLLLIPTRTPQQQPLPRSLEVDIDFLPAPVPAPPTTALPRTEPPVPVAEPIPEAPPVPLTPPRTQPPPAEPDPDTASRPALTTALLLEQAHLQDIDRASPDVSTLGVPDLPELPRNMTRPLLPITVNAFDDFVISGEQELIDQWMEPNGTVNAVVRLPNGEVLCGRAEAWDPMTPLYEPVAMYRSCGGGGKRKPSATSPFGSRN